jgi:type I restriction enzyme R subunit
MQDHGLFQAICRTNRLGKEEEDDPYYKEFGYIVDYQNLLTRLNNSITNYTSDAFDSFDAEDVEGLLTERLTKAKERLNDAIEALHELCLAVPAPKQLAQYCHYFCGNPANKNDLKEREERRLTFYQLVVAFFRAYNNIAPEIIKAGYTQAEADKIKKQVNDYTELRNSIKHYSGDYIDLKKHEPEMRQMLDMYLSADPSRMLSNLGEATLLQLIVDNGIEQATKKLPKAIQDNRGAMGETIENNMRKTIIQEMPVNPAYYEKMSALLLELIRLRKEGVISYEELLKKYEALAKEIQPNIKKPYPVGIDTPAQKALYDNLEQNTELALLVDLKMEDRDDDWRNNHFKKKKVKQFIREAFSAFNSIDESEIERIYQLVFNQREY